MKNKGSLKSQNVFSLSQEKSSQHWFFRYKIYHILFWIVYHYTWAVINGGKPLEVLNFMFSSPKFLFYVIFQAFAVYFNLYFLIPRYLEKSKYAFYLFSMALTIICTSSLIVSGYYLSASLQQSTLLQLYGSDSFFHFFLKFTLPSTLTSMMLAMSIKLTKNWIQAKQREQLLEKEKLETELKFLRSQFNPHFLFNSINSIFVLIHKNPLMASEALAKFSDLLRYQLYECNEHEISLTQELTYLHNYIELEKLRHSQNLALTLQVDTHPPDLTIAPFVLIPFIENAFKHVSQRKDQQNWIKLDLRFNNNTLMFTIANNTCALESKSRELIQYRGIGLKNVQRRLDLMYPDEHKLTIEQGHDQFKVILNLHLRESKVTERKVVSV